MVVAGSQAFVFAPIAAVMLKFVVTRRAVVMFCSLYVVMLFVNVFQFQWYPSVGLYLVVTFVDIGCYMGCLIVLQSFSFAICPPQYN